MDRLCQHLLASAALPLNEHGQLGRRHLLCDPEHPAERRALPQEPYAYRAWLRAPQGLEFHLPPPALEGTAHHNLHLLEVKRLAEEVIGSSAGGLQGYLTCTEGRHEDDRHIWSQLLVVREQLQPIPIGQFVI